MHVSYVCIPHTLIKGQKLSERKVLQFTRFHSNLSRISFHASSKKAIAHKIYRENFCVLSKIHKNRKTFLPLAFVAYSILHVRATIWFNFITNSTVNLFHICKRFMQAYACMQTIPEFKISVRNF